MKKHLMLSSFVSQAIVFTLITAFHQHVIKRRSTSMMTPRLSRTPRSIAYKRISRKELVMLNQRKLHRLSKRDNHKQTLYLLTECYPHLSVSSDILECIDNHNATWSHDTLLTILYKDTNHSRSDNDEILIVDGRFITSVLDRVRSAHYAIPLALHLLKLSVDGVLHNRQIRQTFTLEGLSNVDYQSQEDHNDANELRLIYKSVISLMAHAIDAPGAIISQIILHLLDHHISNVANIKPGPEIYHAVLNALAKCGNTNEVLNLLEAMEQSFDEAELVSSQILDSTTVSNYNATSAHQYPPVDQMSYQTVVSALSKHGSIDNAISTLYRMKAKGFLPDTNCYNVVLIGIAKEAGREKSMKSSDGKWHKVALRMLQEMEQQNITPTEHAYNSAIAACAKEGAWDVAANIEQKEKNLINGLDNSLNTTNTSSCDATNTSRKIHKRSDSSLNELATYYQDLECYRKVGKGKDSWWEIGQYKRPNSSNIVIGIQPHKNPVRNGISLVFYDEISGLKLGRMLLKNSFCKTQRCHPNGVLFSSIVGMEVNKSIRGQGLSKLFVSIWLKICLSTNTYPRAAIMNKPLIALVLMKFGFVPQEGGTCVELIRLTNRTERIDRLYNGVGPYNATFGLYSSSKKSLQGLFSERVLRSQNIAILSHDVPPSVRENSVTIYLKTTFEHQISIVDNVVVYNPPDGYQWELFQQDQTEQDEDRSTCQRRILSQQLEDMLQDQLFFVESTDQLQLVFSRFIS